VAPPGNQAANGENKHQPKYRKKPVYSTQFASWMFDASGIALWVSDLENSLIRNRGGDSTRSGK